GIGENRWIPDPPTGVTWCTVGTIAVRRGDTSSSNILAITLTTGVENVWAATMVQTRFGKDAWSASACVSTLTEFPFPSVKTTCSWSPDPTVTICCGLLSPGLVYSQISL